jgi:hypothetical protein
MKKLSTKHKVFFIILAAVFFISWASGIARFDYAWAEVLGSILLFPFGFLQFMLDTYLWNNYDTAHWINDEFTGLFLFLLAVIGQTFVYYFVYKLIVKNKKKTFC